jgi:hypothetical protein
LGLEAALADPSDALELGQPPPPDYPRVNCTDIYVYKVWSSWRDDRGLDGARHHR